jgi:PAS domain S-box-containing protein
VSEPSSHLLRSLPILPGILAGPVVLVDREGGILHLNPAVEALCGCRSDEVRGRPVAEVLIPASHRERFLQVFGEVLEGVRTDPVEIPLQGADRAIRPILWTYSRLEGEGGETDGILATGTDLTELRLLEARERTIRESEARFSGIVEVASDAIVSIDAEQRIVLFNHGAEAIFGYRAEEVMGEPLDLLLPPSARSVHREHVDRFGASPVPSRRMGERSVIRGRRRGGEEFPAEASILKLTVKGERHYTVVLRDVTDRVRREAAQTFLARVGEVLAGTLEPEETLGKVARLTVEALADFCMIDLLDGEGGGVRRMEALHRDPARKAVATAFLDLPLDRGRPHLMHAVLKGAPHSLVPRASREALEALAQSPEHLALLETLEPRSWIVVPLVARGRLLGTLLCLRCGGEGADPDRPFGGREFDEEDLSLALELGRRAGVAVDNAFLFRDARRALEARDEVLGIVSHDLGNPLQAVFIGLEALERSRAARTEGRPGQEEYYLTAIRRSVEVMERLIRDLMEVRRMEAGHLQIDPRPRCLEDLVAEALEMLRPLAGVKNIRIVNEVAGADLPLVPADGDRIQQVLSNLVGNAVKHTPEGGTVRLSARASEVELVVQVEDTGPGIPPEDLERVFDRFWRAGKRKERGIGLGLAIARGIVRGHGGHIWAESTAGTGSVFSFSLPLGDRSGASATAEVGSPPTEGVQVPGEGDPAPSPGRPVG